MFRNYRIYPENKLKASDIDLILISKTHYDKFRNAYLQKYYSKLYINEYKYVQKCVFRKFINFIGFNEKDIEYNLWLQNTNNYQKELQENFGIRHNVNYLIFESWEAADSYYINNLNKIKEIIRSTING